MINPLQFMQKQVVNYMNEHEECIVQLALE